MPTYRITRLWSVAGYAVTEVVAGSEAEARATEEARWDESGAQASLPADLRARVEDVFDEVEAVEEIAGS